MTAGEHEMPPHLARYVASLSDPGTGGDATPRVITPIYDVDRYLPPARTETGRPAPEASQGARHVDPAAHAGWRQAQTELAGLIRAGNRTPARNPEAARTLPASLADWMAKRAAELEQAEASEPEIDFPG